MNICKCKNPSLYICLIFCFINHITTAEVLFRDTFDYPADTPLSGQGEWTSRDGLEGISFVIADSVTYTDTNGISAFIRGNSFEMVNSFDEDLWAVFDSVSDPGSVVYASFILHIPEFATFTSSGEYIAHLNQGQTIARGRIYATAFGDTVELGIRYRNDSTIEYSLDNPIALERGETYMVVIKIEMIAGANNDTASLFINPELDQPEPEPYAMAFNDGGQDVQFINGFTLRQNSGTTGDFIIDDVRVGTTWEDVTSTLAPPDDVTGPEISLTGPSGQVTGAVTHVSVQFEEDVIGVKAEDITVNGSAATSVNGKEEVPYIFTGFALPAPGNVIVSINRGAITDTEGNPFAGDSWSFQFVETVNELLAYEPFDYENQTALASLENWGGNVPIDGLKILNHDAAGDNGTSSLAYPGLPGTGGRVLSTQTFSGESNYALPISLVGENQVFYTSFLYRPGNAVGNSYIAFNVTNGSIQGQLGRWDVIRTASDPNHNFAARFRDAASRDLEQGEGHPIGTTVFLVAKTSINPPGQPDTFELWINPAVNSSESASDLQAVAQGENDINPATGILGFGLRVSNSTGIFEMDELRMGTTWESVTQITVDVKDWSLF